MSHILDVSYNPFLPKLGMTPGAPPTKAVIGEPADFRGWCER